MASLCCKESGGGLVLADTHASSCGRLMSDGEVNEAATLLTAEFFDSIASDCKDNLSDVAEAPDAYSHKFIDELAKSTQCATHMCEKL